MNDLLQRTLDAHGGLANWKKYGSVSARLRGGGALWALKQQAGVLADIQIRCSTQHQYASFSPFVQPDWHNTFEPDRVAILSSQNEVIDELTAPRDSFAGYVSTSPWSWLQLTYFTGYAMWTYLNAPFIFARTDYQVRELAPWQENNELFRRLEVRFPAQVATHNPVQTFYIDELGLIRRHDYNVDISQGVPSAHYIGAYVDVQGLKVATQRQVYGRLADNSADLSGPVYVSINLSELQFS